MTSGFTDSTAAPLYQGDPDGRPVLPSPYDAWQCTIRWIWSQTPEPERWQSRVHSGECPERSAWYPFSQSKPVRDAKINNGRKLTLYPIAFKKTVYRSSMVVFSLSVWLSRFRIKKPKKHARIMICGILPSAKAIKRLFGNRSRTIFLQVSCHP